MNELTLIDVKLYIGVCSASVNHFKVLTVAAHTDEVDP